MGRRCVLLCALFTASCFAEGRARQRLTAQEDNISKMIQNIKDKLVVNNEEYMADSFSEGEFNFLISAAQLRLDTGDPDLAQFQFSVDRPAIEQNSKRARPQRGTEREITLALRTRPVSNERLNVKETQFASSTVKVLDPYTTDSEDTKRVELRSTQEDAPAKRYSVASNRGVNWKPLQVMNVHRNTDAAAVVVPNFYPISQPEQQAENKDRLIIRQSGRDLRTTARSSMLMRNALTPKESTVHSAGIGGSAKQQSGFVTFKYKAKIPLEVPLSRRWIANAFGSRDS